MPNLSGLEAAREIKKLYPEVKILILSMHKSKGCLKGAVLVGVNGYLLKEEASKPHVGHRNHPERQRIYISPPNGPDERYLFEPED
jgi:DNA-binding NarL/FixJ family response regulator